MSSSTVTFKVMSTDRDYQFQLATELCNWDNFRESLMEQSTELLGTPLYYFDSNNVKQMITDSSSLAAMLLDSDNCKVNIIHLYSDNNTHSAATATTSEWVFAPEEEATDDAKRSAPSDNATPFSDLYSTCFRQLGQLIAKHSSLIESNPHLRVLISRFASSIAATPDTEMISRLDQWLISYDSSNNNDDKDKPATANDNKEHDKRHKHRHRGRHVKEDRQYCNERRNIIASLPDDLSYFLLADRLGRRHHHSGPPHPWIDQHHSTHGGFMPSLWGCGMHMHKHKHQHHHHHRHSLGEQPPRCPLFSADPSRGDFDPTANGPWGAHPLFNGRHGKFSMMCSRSDRHFEKAMKHIHRHRHHRHPYVYDIPGDSTSSSSDSTSSSTSSSENEDNAHAEQQQAGTKRQHKKLWKAIAKEQIRRSRGHHSHHGRPGPDGFFGYGRHNGPMTFFAGRPPFDGQALPPPGYIEQSFGQMHLDDSKKQ